MTHLHNATFRLPLVQNITYTMNKIPTAHLFGLCLPTAEQVENIESEYLVIFTSIMNISTN